VKIGFPNLLSGICQETFLFTDSISHHSELKIWCFGSTRSCSIERLSDAFSSFIIFQKILYELHTGIYVNYIQDAFQKWVSFWYEKGGYSVLTYFLLVCFQLWKHFRNYSLVTRSVHCCCHQRSSWLTAIVPFSESFIPYLCYISDLVPSDLWFTPVSVKNTPGTAVCQ
jgi:hypothetical protein